MSDRPPYRIDEEVCVGHGRCYSVAPESFDADDMGHGVVRDQQQGPASREPDSIINSCPEGAIELVTVGGNAEEGTPS